MDFGVVIESVNFPKEGREGGVFRQNERPAGNTDLRGTLFLAGNVGPRGRIFPHAKEYQPGKNALLAKGLNPSGGLLMDLGGEGLSIEKACGHPERMP